MCANICESFLPLPLSLIPPVWTLLQPPRWLEVGMGAWRSWPGKMRCVWGACEVTHHMYIHEQCGPPTSLLPCNFRNGWTRHSTQCLRFCTSCVQTLRTRLSFVVTSSLLLREISYTRVHSQRKGYDQPSYCSSNIIMSCCAPAPFCR